MVVRGGLSHRRGFLRRILFRGGGAGAAVAAGKAVEYGRPLVLVFLRGAMDGLNTVVPYGDDDYHRLRPHLGLAAPDRKAPAGSALLDMDGRFGLHPALAPLHPHWAEGRLAVVHAIGSDDTTRSHFEAQDRMEHGAFGDGAVSGGWIARWLRSRAAPGPSALRAVALGETLPESLRGAPAAGALRSVDEMRVRGRDADATGLVSALEALHGTGAGDDDDAVAAAGRETLALLRRVQDLPADAPADAAYPDDPFGGALSQVARLLRARIGVEAACLDLGGFDTHFGQGTLADGLAGGLAAPLRSLGGGLAAFARDLGPLLEETTVLVLTEFGRRAYENTALGTDHGSASVAFVLGGGLHGGRVHGPWPGLRPEDLHEESDLRVTTDYRNLVAEILLRRCGGADLATVFPGLEPVPVGVCR